ncbi:MAG: TlpA family protein disulfide reductase [Granulosicoccus sp.]|nr:TlpA family protein disulfide reductase [Granulosicoccus sp.]
MTSEITVNRKQALLKPGLTIAAILLLAIVGSTLLKAGDSGVELAPFSITTDGGEISSESLKGKLVYVDFWASWCAPCRESFPWMNEMQAKYADQGFKVIAVTLDKERKFSDQFLAEVPADFTIGYDPEGLLADQFKVIGMPMAYMIDRRGKLVGTHVGFRKSKREEFESAIKEHL